MLFQAKPASMKHVIYKYKGMSIIIIVQYFTFL